MEKLLYSIRGPVCVRTYKELLCDSGLRFILTNELNYYLKTNVSVEKMIRDLCEYKKCYYLISPKNLKVDNIDKIIQEVSSNISVKMCMIKDSSYIMLTTNNVSGIKFENDEYCYLFNDMTLDEINNDIPLELGISWYVVPILLTIIIVYVYSRSKGDPPILR